MGVVGGLTIASFLTLYVIPALYFIFVHDTAKPRRNRIRRFLMKLRGKLMPSRKGKAAV